MTRLSFASLAFSATTPASHFLPDTSPPPVISAQCSARRFLTHFQRSRMPLVLIVSPNLPAVSPLDASSLPASASSPRAMHCGHNPSECVHTFSLCFHALTSFPGASKLPRAPIPPSVIFICPVRRLLHTTIHLSYRSILLALPTRAVPSGVPILPCYRPNTLPALFCPLRRLHLPPPRSAMPADCHDTRRRKVRYVPPSSAPLPRSPRRSFKFASSRRQPPCSANRRRTPRYALPNSAPVSP